jgi:hypothetical protein
MAFAPLRIGQKAVTVHKAHVAPDFGAKTVLVSDTWDYVEMWLKRHHKGDGLFYWQQARHFFGASVLLPKTSSPLTTYYCFLNAVKALLTVKGQVFKEVHGVGGERVGDRTSLANEIVKFQASGILSALCAYLGEPANGETASLKDLLYNLPYVHRAYALTYSSQQELFIPIAYPRFVKKDGSSEAWFCADITDPKFQNARTLKKLPSGYEREMGVTDCWMIRKKRRFDWKHGRAQAAGNITRLSEYHRKLRTDVVYIHGPARLWYLKRGGVNAGVIARSAMTMTFAIMHRLSELARYEPMLLARHFEVQHNWLLSEFLATALHHFIDEVSSELTGHDFMIPGRKGIV